MAEIRDFWLKRHRWDWTKYGYEEGFPRKCAWSDIDGVVEFDEKCAMYEFKRWDGEIGLEHALAEIPRGQRKLHQALRSTGASFFVLFGVPENDDPLAAFVVTSFAGKYRGRWHDWRGVPIDVRRKELRGLVRALLDASEGPVRAAKRAVARWHREDLLA